MEPIRLQKFFTDNKIMSRRAAEREIENGNVSVNGVTAVIGQKIDPDKDIVTLNGKKIESASVQRHTYIMLNKPIGYVTTMSDEKGRKCVTELIKDVPERIYPVGRLDMYSEGLLLLTNDGELTNRLTHPRHHIGKVYHVKIKGRISPDITEKLAQPMTIDGYELKPVKVRLISVKDDCSVIEMILFEGRNRQIRKMCESLDLVIMRLTRIAIGEINLGDLAPGKWRYLTKSQVDYLKNAGKK